MVNRDVLERGGLGGISVHTEGVDEGPPDARGVLLTSVDATAPTDGSRDQAMDAEPASGAWCVRIAGMRTYQALMRASRLRCPYCGVGRVMRSWFSLGEACSECGLRFERDERDDYWLGAYLLNFIATEVVFALWLTVLLIDTWPDPPWTAVIWLGVLQMCLTPIVFYPFAKALWLAIDLAFRPAKPEDFA